jgi:hypothetical protein
MFRVTADSLAAYNALRLPNEAWRLRLREARQRTGPPSQLFLLLALGVGLITLLVCALGVLLSTP